MAFSTQSLLLLLAFCALAAATAPDKPPRYRNDMTVLAPDAAGIDVGADFHMVAVPPDEHGHVEVRRFGACTADLRALADWLTAHRVSTVALESTGVYWIPLFDLLEQRGFAVFLVDPRQTRRTAGRPKSDYADAQWIRRLHSIGMLTAAFRPPRQIRHCAATPATRPTWSGSTAATSSTSRRRWSR
jgi:transposase